MWLKIVSLVSNALVPLVVLFIGTKLNERLKTLEQTQWANQKLVEKKLALFDEIMPKINDLLCFYTFVGNWKDISPEDVINLKRYLDKQVHIYAGESWVLIL